MNFEVFFLEKNAPKKDREFCKQMRKWVQSFDTTVITFAKPGFRHFVTGCFPLRLNYRRVYVVIERELQRKPLLHKVFILHPLFISLCNNRQFIWQHKIKNKVIFLIKQLIYIWFYNCMNFLYCFWYFLWFKIWCKARSACGSGSLDEQKSNNGQLCITQKNYHHKRGR